MKHNLFIILGICIILSCTNRKSEPVPEKGFVSWLPAATWEDALLSGNGTIGAMIMGYPYEETIILNQAQLFLPNETPLVPPNMAASLNKIRELSFAGKWKEVADLGAEVWKKAGYGSLKWTDPYVPAADLRISMPATNITNYKRMVDFETAEAIVDWTDQKGHFTRKTFVSRADGIMVTQIKGSNSVNSGLYLQKHPHSWEQNSFVNPLLAKSELKTISRNIVQYHCEYAKPHENGIKGYNCFIRVYAKNGSVDTTRNTIEVKNASEVLVFTAIEPFYSLENNKADSILNKLKQIKTDYSFLLERQKKVHGELYNRMSLNLFPTESERNMTSETMVLSAKKTSTPGIVQRQFEAARYNILCATGINPPNLQGIWSGTWTPPWSGDFTQDGNVEVAISNLLNGNMCELMKGYFEFHQRMMPYYRINAKQFYGAKGIHIPAHSSTHGFNNHFDNTWCLEYWNGAAGWTASYFYDYFLYTGDTAFLREKAFPFITEALQFWEDFLITDKDGKYITAPSYSPENNPLEQNQQNCINATMDFAIIRQILTNWINSAKILGLTTDEIKKKEEMLIKIPDYQISSDGVIKEWMWPGFTDNQTHRHASHLYGLYEVPDEMIYNSPNLREAALKTIKERMKIRKEHLGGEMAFGMCHLGFSAVNIGDTETASEIVEYLSRFYWTNGMASTHNPGNLFNMDISGGFPSLITRMIANSRPGQIDILPAIPDSWKKGEAKGIRCRGNIVIHSVLWNENKIELMLSSEVKQKVVLNLSEKRKVKKVEIDGKNSMDKNSVFLNIERGKKLKIIWNL